MSILVTQNSDGSITLPGATAVTIRQTASGLVVSANDTLILPSDTGPALAVKIAKAKNDLTITQADLSRIGADLA